MKHQWNKQTAVKALKKRWGDKFVGSIFPVSEGKHRVTLQYKGKEYVFGGEDRVKLLTKAFEVLNKE